MSTKSSADQKQNIGLSRFKTRSQMCVFLKAWVKQLDTVVLVNVTQTGVNNTFVQDYF